MWTCDHLDYVKHTSTHHTRFLTAIYLLPCFFWRFNGESAFVVPLAHVKPKEQSFGFALEFHLPYYALRRSATLQEDPRGLRRCGSFIPKRETSNVSEFIYEAQISVMVTGIDEWFWTAYCCTETHFGSEASVQTYHEYGLDAPTGGEKSNVYPTWNPREYFLLILSCRIKQITKEWSNILDALEERLQYHVKQIFVYDRLG